MVEVSDRSAATLVPIILEFIKPGTTVISDEWRAYSRINMLNMSHDTVNHSVNFVDPQSGAHTQNIESTWASVKKMMRKECVLNTRDELFQTYLSAYLWRKKFKDSDPFTKIYEHIKQQYPLQLSFVMFYDYSFMSNHCILCHVICVFKLFLLYDKQLFLIERNIAMKT